MFIEVAEIGHDHHCGAAPIIIAVFKAFIGAFDNAAVVAKGYIFPEKTVVVTEAVGESVGGGVE